MIAACRVTDKLEEPVGDPFHKEYSSLPQASTDGNLASDRFVSVFSRKHTNKCKKKHSETAMLQSECHKTMYDRRFSIKRLKSPCQHNENK